MQRRGITVLVGAITVAVLAGGVMAAPVPYVILDPGPTVDTLGEQDGAPVIEITGTETFESQGQLRLTTVGVDPEVNLLTAIRAWFDGDEAVVPRELIYPPDQRPEEVEERNQQQFTQSQNSAEVAALRHLGYPAQVVVREVLEGQPASGRLQPDDVIVSVDGTEATSVGELQELVTADPAGTSLRIGYVRDSQAGTVEITTAADPRDGRTPRIGVAVGHEMDVPFEVTFDLDRIGGPSAGLMFALGIIDMLEPEDLTGGQVIAGTGSIEDNGTVGPIGGLPQKLVAAHEVGATAFLVPAQNCPEAVASAQPEMVLIKVETLADALDGLAALRGEGEPVTC
jgi:PDZ domain-containing protein